jgi:hypothetical protein
MRREGRARHAADGPLPGAPLVRFEVERGGRLVAGAVMATIAPRRRRAAEDRARVLTWRNGSKAAYTPAAAEDRLRGGGHSLLLPSSLDGADLA